MKVLDAGVVVELLAGDLDPARLGNEELAAPHLIDSEVTHVLRGLVRRSVLSEEQGTFALEGFVQLTLTRCSDRECGSCDTTSAPTMPPTSR